VPVLQHGAAGARSRQAGIRQVWGIAGRDLAADRAEQPQVRASEQLSFPILSDAKGTVGAAFGLRFNLPDYLVELYKQLKNDLPTFNDDPSWTLPMPARYVIGQDGVILYSEVNPDYTRRPEPEDMIPVLQQAAAVKA
jgi:peroxiredoxin